MDYKGDYLDAAICALQAAEVLKMRNFDSKKFRYLGGVDRIELISMESKIF